MQYDITMLVLNDVAYDGRVRFEASTLASAGWRVLVIGTQRANGTFSDHETHHGFDIHRVRYKRMGASLYQPWRLLRHSVQAIQIIRTLRKTPARAYHAHDLPALILLWLARRHTTVYDSHELYLFLTNNGRQRTLKQRLMMCFERHLAKHTDAVITVCDTMSRTLARWYGIQPIVVKNIKPPAVNDTQPSVDLRAVVGQGKRCIVHTGDITEKGRALRELVAALPLLPDDTVLVLLGQGEAETALCELAASLGIRDRLFIVPPVQPEEVALTIQTADAAAVLLRPDSLHFRATLPNKLFEAVAAGLPVVASDSFPLKRIVKKYALGIVCSPQPAQIANAFNQLLEPERQKYFREQVRHAQQALNPTVEAQKLCTLYQRLLS